jgi:hypothetical protein
MTDSSNNFSPLVHDERSALSRAPCACPAGEGVYPMPSLENGYAIFKFYA